MRGRLVVRFAACVVLAFCGTTAHAQPRPDAGSVLESTKQPAIAPKPGADVLPRIQEPKPALGAPGLKVVVTAFKISGNTLYPESVLLEAVAEFVGKEQNIDGLNDAATKVRAYYRERGYFLAQAYLPQQEIKGGVIEIAVIEARVGKVALNFKEGTRFSESLIRGIIETHLRQGDIITENGLETPLLLLNDLPNAVVTSEIRPSQTIGSADLTIHVSDTPGWISGSVQGDNYGNRFTGALRTSLNVNINSPLSLGDLFTYNALVSDERMGLNRIGYVLPVGPWGTRIGVSYTSFHYRLGRDFLNDGLHGVGAITGIAVFHPIIRTRGANVILQASYDDKSLNDRNESIQSIEDRTITGTHIGFVGDLRDGMLGGGLNSFAYTYTEGNAMILTPLALAVDQVAGAGRFTNGRFARHNYEFRRLQKITDNASLLLGLQGQLASKNMMSAEKFSLGGASGVRAYPAGEALGDTGYLFQAEFRYNLPGVKFAGGGVSLTGFWDQGWVRLNQDALATDTANERHLSGYGIGASLGKEADFLLRVSAAWRNENEAPVSDTARRTPRYWVQAIKWF